jgi:ribosomal 50S subunit-associated protein YjgA (DUF615 family)
MHSLHNDDFLTLPSLTAAQRDHLRAKVLPRDLLAEEAAPAVRDRAHGLRRWMRSQAGLLREKLADCASQHWNHPQAKEYRAELRTLEQVRERLILAELAPVGWLLEDVAGVAAGHFGDVCHGMEVGL